ncbi:hypothetical protein D3C75_531670 [compost metagenome]
MPGKSQRHPVKSGRLDEAPSQNRINHHQQCQPQCKQSKRQNPSKTVFHGTPQMNNGYLTLNRLFMVKKADSHPGAADKLNDGRSRIAAHYRIRLIGIEKQQGDYYGGHWCKIPL